MKLPTTKNECRKLRSLPSQREIQRLKLLKSNSLQHSEINNKLYRNSLQPAMFGYREMLLFNSNLSNGADQVFQPLVENHKGQTCHSERKESAKNVCRSFFEAKPSDLENVKLSSLIPIV